MIAGLVLAAGAGRRFGDAPKLLADLGGRPVLQHAIDAACAAGGLDRVVVVLGARAREVRAAIDLRSAEAIVCDAWDEGQSASLRCGLERLADAEKVLVLLGDQPLVTPAVVTRMAGEPPGARAAYDGAPGFPAVLGPEQVRRARDLRGDQGLRGETWRLVECGPTAGARDVDTPEDLEAVRDEARAVL